MYPEISLELGENIYFFKTYTIFMFFSIIIGLLLSYIQLKRKIKHALGFLIGLILSFIIGARLLNYVVNYSFYQNNNLSLVHLKVVGFSFYGGILASIFFIAIMGSILRINIWHITDQMILPFGISFFIMRFGCFLNGCCFGKFTTCILGIHLPQEAFTSIFTIFSNTLKIHPTQLYEGLGALAGVIFFSIYKKKIKTKGLLTIYYGIYLTVIRWIVLYLRDLEYSRWVIYYFYPALYFILILTGLFLIHILKSNPIDHSNNFNNDLSQKSDTC